MSSPSVFDKISSPQVRESLQKAAAAARRIVAGTASVADHAAMTHSWIFTGPPGSGRTIAARAFAAALMCENPEKVGCGTCQDCRTVLGGTHADFLHMMPSGKTYLVDDVKRVIEQAYALPTTAPWRVILFEEADRFNDPSANALLKSVEEPPERTVFLMSAPSTAPEDFKVTLRSRCRHVYVPSPSADFIADLLLAEQQQKPQPGQDPLTEDQALWAAAAASGHIGRARALARNEESRQRRMVAVKLPEVVYEPARSYLYSSELFASAAEEAERQWQPVEERELAELEQSLGMGATGRGVQASLRGTKGRIDELQKDQKRRRRRAEQDFLDLALLDVLSMYRDALVVATTAQTRTSLNNPDRGRAAAELARRNTPEQLLQCIDAVTQTRLSLGGNVRPEVALDGMMGQLQQICRVGQ